MLGSDYAGDYGYAGTRIIGTVVRHEGIPVSVSGTSTHPASGKPMAFVRRLRTGEESHVDLDDLDLEPFKLGYVNFVGQASYICRMPMRRDYKQGLRTNNIISHYGFSHKDIPIDELYDTLVNKFPSYEESYQAVKDGGASTAWHLNWAMDNKGNLLYRSGKVVGTIEDGVATLNPKFSYLSKQLKETLQC